MLSRDAPPRDPSGDQPGFLAELHRLRAPPGAELVEQPAGVRLDRILADEEPIRDFAVAESRGDQAENLQFARRDAQFAHAFVVGGERTIARRRALLDENFLPSCERQ